MLDARTDRDVHSLWRELHNPDRLIELVITVSTVALTIGLVVSHWYEIGLTLGVVAQCAVHIVLGVVNDA